MLQNASAEELKLLSGFVGFSGLLTIVKANRKKISDRIENIKFRYFARQELGKDAVPELLVDRIVNTFEKENKTKGSTLTLFKNVFSSVYDKGEELLEFLASVKKEKADSANQDPKKKAVSGKADQKVNSFTIFKDKLKKLDQNEEEELQTFVTELVKQSKKHQKKVQKLKDEDLTVEKLENLAAEGVHVAKFLSQKQKKKIQYPDKYIGERAPVERKLWALEKSLEKKFENSISEQKENRKKNDTIATIKEVMNNTDNHEVINDGNNPFFYDFRWINEVDNEWFNHYFKKMTPKNLQSLLKAQKPSKEDMRLVKNYQWKHPLIESFVNHVLETLKTSEDKKTLKTLEEEILNLKIASRTDFVVTEEDETENARLKQSLKEKEEQKKNLIRKILRRVIREIKDKPPAAPAPPPAASTNNKRTRTGTIDLTNPTIDPESSKKKTKRR